MPNSETTARARQSSFMHIHPATGFLAGIKGVQAAVHMAAGNLGVLSIPCQYWVPGLSTGWGSRDRNHFTALAQPPHTWQHPLILEGKHLDLLGQGQFTLYPQPQCSPSVVQGTHYFMSSLWKSWVLFWASSFRHFESYFTRERHNNFYILVFCLILMN